MRLPEASWSRMVTVAMGVSPSTASTGSSGPRTTEKDSCHSLSSLDRISTLNRMWSIPAEDRQSDRRCSQAEGRKVDDGDGRQTACSAHLE